MKKKMVQNLKWATAHLNRRLGAGLGARDSDTTRGRRARGASGRAGHARQADAGQAPGRGAAAARRMQTIN